jgi:hypothetical protein
MSVKGKDKIDDTISVVSDNGGEGTLILIIIIIVVELKKDTFIKIRELTVFTGDRAKFTAYKMFVGLCYKPGRTQAVSAPRLV